MTREVGADTTNMSTVSTTLCLASGSCTGNAHTPGPSGRQEPDAALKACFEPCMAQPDACITTPPDLLTNEHESCQRVEEASSRHAAVDRAEQVVGDSYSDCVICWERNAQVVFQPCGHMCSCSACVDSCLGSASLCPMCRCVVVATIYL